MQTVYLHHLKFFSFHGLYEEEKSTGNEFEVNLSVSFDRDKVGDDLSRTVDYVQLFQIVKSNMNTPALLLEGIAESVIATIQSHYPFVQKVNIEIWKMQPPIEQFQGKVGISLTKTF